MPGSRGSAVGVTLSVDEATVLVALLRYAAETVGPDLLDIANRYADLLSARARSHEAAHAARRYEDLRARFASLQGDVAAARDTSARLANEAQELRATARTLRGVIGDVVSLLGVDGDVALDGTDPRLLHVRQILRDVTAA